MLFQFNVGPQTYQDGATQTARGGRLGDLIVSELQGRFGEAAWRGQLFSGGMTLTSISNVTFTSGTLGATCTPITGLWNPAGSGVNAFVLQATLGVQSTASTATGGGPYVWATSTGNSLVSLTTGAAPLSRKTLQAVGSVCKDMSGAALTGLTNNLALRQASGLSGGDYGNFSFVGTAAGPDPVYIGSVENLDGGIIVPPGGILALLATTTPVAHSAASGLLWFEFPYIS